MLERNTMNYTQEQVNADRKEILNALDTDPKAQECLRLYRLLPDNEKKNMLNAMDAFLRGFREGQDAAAG